MATHRLDPTPETVTDVFSRDLPPVLTVEPGDTLVVRTLDASGRLERQRTPGETTPQLLGNRRGHCLAGPIAVRGAEPGMMLAVRLVSLRPDTWGWTVLPGGDDAKNKRLGLVSERATHLLWELDADKLTGTNQHGLTVDLAPFLGVVGLSPAAPGEHSTIPPRACGGNLDCRELVAGSTLFLPVEVSGGLLYAGDGHGAQGDGEVCGTAVECGMTTELVVDLVTEPPIPTAHALTPAGRVTFGLDSDLNEATMRALDAMLDWMSVLYDVDRRTAMALASSCVSMRVTQIANEVWGVHALLPEGALR